MAVCYDKLFHRMIDERMTNAQLMSMAGFSANIITRLSYLIWGSDIPVKFSNSIFLERLIVFVRVKCCKAK